MEPESKYDIEVVHVEPHYEAGRAAVIENYKANRDEVNKVAASHQADLNYTKESRSVTGYLTSNGKFVPHSKDDPDYAKGIMYKTGAVLVDVTVKKKA